MTESTAKVGPKGQVVIPKRIRDELGIRVGERVTVAREGTEVRVRRILSLDELQGAFTGRGGTKDLEREHRDELRREERRARRARA
ncbi:MAG TPA: AbrB/MazE/SpoVT family DNA-binding domain-containing protein [Gaiellaceae bacterium]|jgi:AbrB family looped-hinge helix DNA binding protein|nr:AbrB/MazE/SpoVT family DNA-binding domain-containing protein [Gaiellaceae bacterium]